MIGTIFHRENGCHAVSSAIQVLFFRNESCSTIDSFSPLFSPFKQTQCSQSSTPQIPLVKSITLLYIEESLILVTRRLPTFNLVHLGISTPNHRIQQFSIDPHKLFTWTLVPDIQFLPEQYIQIPSLIHSARYSQSSSPFHSQPKNTNQCTLNAVINQTNTKALGI
jgi:hypothetical protein